MDATSSTSSEKFTCLVCGAKCEHSNLGINACRACTIFYRRVKNQQKDLRCRTGLGQCDIGRRGSCKRCRFTRFVRLLNQEPMKLDPCSLMVTEREVPSPEKVPETEPPIFWPASETFIKYVAKRDPFVPDVRCPILSKLRYYYKEFAMRRTFEEVQELRGYALKDGEEVTFTASSHATFIRCSSINMNALVDFASNVTPEFSTYADDDQWRIITSATEGFFVLEMAYRGHVHFPENLDSTVLSFTTYCHGDAAVDKHFEGFKDADLEQAKLTALANRHGMQRLRKLLQENPIDENEFLVAQALQLWDSMNVTLPESITQNFEDLRMKLLLDLHRHYRFRIRIGLLMSSLTKEL